MNTTIKIILGICAGGIIVYLLTRKKAVSVPQAFVNPSVTPSNCITPPSNFEAYKGSTINWGGYAQGVKDLVGDYDKNEPLVHGFLKGLNIQPKRTYVQYYLDDIQNYIQENQALPHWEVVKGAYNCAQNGSFPEDIQLL